MEQIVNGELGSSVRNKLNLLITKYNNTVSVRNDFDPRGLIVPSTNVAITSRDLFDNAGADINGVIEADITNTSTNIVLNGLPSIIEADNNHFIGATVKTLETSSVTLQVIDGDNEENILGSTEVESTSEYKDVIIDVKPTVSINNPYIKILINSSESVNNISIKDIIAVKTDEFLGYSAPVIDKKTIDLTTKYIADTATLNEVSLKVNNKTRIELNEAPDGEKTIFTTSKIFLAGTADVYVNRLKQYKGKGAGFDYIEKSTNSIEFAVAPKTEDIIVLEAVEATYIQFKDREVKKICVTNWGNDGELTCLQASLVSLLNLYFRENKNIISFEELQHFIGLSEIEPASFQNCSELNSIILPNNITSIGESAFGGCSKLTSIIIPNSVTLIKEWAFLNCSGLTSIIIPNSVTSISDFAFNGCTSLISISLDTITPPTLGFAVFSGDANLAHIYVPDASVDIYKAATGWSTYAAIISAINPPR